MRNIPTFKTYWHETAKPREKLKWKGDYDLKYEQWIKQKRNEAYSEWKDIESEYYEAMNKEWEEMDGGKTMDNAFKLRYGKYFKEMTNVENALIKRISKHKEWN